MRCPAQAVPCRVVQGHLEPAPAVVRRRILHAFQFAAGSSAAITARGSNGRMAPASRHAPVAIAGTTTPLRRRKRLWLSKVG